MDKYCIGKHLESSEQVTHDETYLSFVTVHPTSLTTNKITIRNGEDYGQIVFTISLYNGESKHFTFPYPIKLRNGMNIELSKDTTATIGYFG